jgi:hypothetical protein
VAGDTTIRSKIHGLWESFFPSTIYFVVFVAIALFSFGFEHAAELSRAGQFDDYASSKLYLLLKDLELLKLVPIAAVFAFAFLVYVFDRLAMMVGNALPPFPVWHGSTALYVEKPYLLALWSLLPDESNVATLDSHARRIIDQAKLDEKPLPSNSFTWLQERQNKAGRMAAYAKAGLVWSVLVLLIAIFSRFLSLRSTAVFFAGIAAFVLLFIWALVLQTYTLIRAQQEQIRVATEILRLQQKDVMFDPNRMNHFDESLENSIRYARRFVGLVWHPRLHASGLINAFFGFRKKSKKATSRQLSE